MPGVSAYCRGRSLRDAKSDSRSLGHDDRRLSDDAKRSLVCESQAFYDDSVVASPHTALRKFISRDVAVRCEVNTFWCDWDVRAEIFVRIRINNDRSDIPLTVGRCTSCDASVSVRGISVFHLP